MTDENGHLWVAASSKEAGKIIEINPDTHAKISDIGKSKLEAVKIFRVVGKNSVSEKTLWNMDWSILVLRFTIFSFCLLLWLYVSFYLKL